MYWVLNLCLIGLFSIGLLNCYSGNTRKATFFGPQPYSKALEASHLNCSDSSDCPQNIGIILAKSHSGPKALILTRRPCTGFLVAENIVATSSKCIPVAVKKKQISCSSELAIQLNIGGSNGKKKIFKCLELIQHDPVKIYQQSLALFKIDATGIKPVKLSRNGLTDGAKISVTAALHLAGNPYIGTLTTESCKVVHDSILNSGATSPWSPTGMGFGCKFSDGHLGAPVFNAQGLVIGIVNARPTRLNNPGLIESFLKYKISTPPVLPDHIVFTNMSCSKLSFDADRNKINSKLCHFGSQLRKEDCLYKSTKKREVEQNSEYHL